MLTQRLRSLLDHRLDPLLGPLHAMKPEGVVAFCWKLLCKVVPKADQTFDLYWNPPVLLSTGLTKEDIVAAMENRASIWADVVQWAI